jgi:hypothetical protein
VTAKTPLSVCGNLASYSTRHPQLVDLYSNEFMRQMYYKFFRTIHFIHQEEKQPKKEGVLVW